MLDYCINANFEECLACPITKEKRMLADFGLSAAGYPICKIDLTHSPGFHKWKLGQSKYENWETSSEYYKNMLASYAAEIEYDRCIYEKFPLEGKVLDVGGGAGTVRQFMQDPNNLISIDPFPDPILSTPLVKKEAYSCFKNQLNFIQGNAEFLPFVKNSFDIVHMRSMLDHVQIPDLALLEAHRVLKPDGFVLIGISVIGGSSGYPSLKEWIKTSARTSFKFLGLKRFQDYHTWHPTFSGLISLIQHNSFLIEEVFWQPKWKGTVVYVKAVPK